MAIRARHASIENAVVPPISETNQVNDNISIYFFFI